MVKSFRNPGPTSAQLTAQAGFLPYEAAAGARFTFIALEASQ